MNRYQLHLGDCLEVMKGMPDNSIDSIVTDPPYGLNFMGKKWDCDVPSAEVWAECLRVLKPGGHLLAFAGTRTQHRMACNIEDAGFEIRDMIAWVYGSGFPKSRNISALDMDGEDAEAWTGWGTALKPALEPITMARKPLAGTIAANVLAHSVGALNIDGCRVPTGEKLSAGSGGLLSTVRDEKAYPESNGFEQHALGRWPANLIHDGSDEVLAAFPDAKGQQGALTGNEPSGKMGHANSYGKMDRRHEAVPRIDTSKSAARFFYCPKVAKRERDEGVEDLEQTDATEMVNRQAGTVGINSAAAGAGRTSGAKNNHPTVKPVDLMAYLCRLVTPAGGVVFDPFMGSGSTGKATMREGFQFIGIEMDPESLAIAEKRIAWEAGKAGKSFVIHETPKAGPCLKAQVKATLIAPNGQRFVGTNGVMNPQTRCPRISSPHFADYGACKSACGQPHHAEVSAIHLAGDLALGSTIYIEGHFAACPDCQGAADAAGVARIVIGAPPVE